MSTIEDLTALRDAARQAYWACKTFQSIVLKSDIEILTAELPGLIDKLNQYSEALGPLCRAALNAVEQAVAIERLPPFLLGDQELLTATQGAAMQLARLRLRSNGDATETRDAVQSLAAVKYDAAANRVLQEWNAAVRMLNGAAKPHSERQRGDSEPRITVDLARKTVTVNDGEPIDVAGEMTLRWIKVLAEHPGEWIPASDLLKYDQQLEGVRPDKFPRLPAEISDLIESKKAAGSRLKIPVA